MTAIDSLKDDTQLMQEETELFSYVDVADQQDELLPQSVYNRQVDKMILLCKRGHMVNEVGGWES
jgi:hypothetical protein